jgi:hypothetical protein
LRYSSEGSDRFNHEIERFLRIVEIMGREICSECSIGPGVYIFRMAGGKLAPRLKGKSDIVYIGAVVANYGSLRKRLAQHLPRRQDPTGIAARILRVEHEVGPLEIAWVTCPDNHRSQAFESELLDKYCVDHIELRIESGQQIRGRMRLVLQLPEDVGRKALEKIRQEESRLSSCARS